MFDGSCTLLQGTSELNNYQKCESVVAFEFQEAENGDTFSLSHVLSKNGTVPTQL